MSAILVELQKTETDGRDKLLSILREAGEKHKGEVLLVRYEPDQVFTLQTGYVCDEQRRRVKSPTRNPIDDKIYPLGMYKLSYEGFAKILSSGELKNVAQKLAGLGY